MRSTIRVSFGNSSPALLINSLSIEMTRFGHELATIEVLDQDIDPALIKDGTPVKASIAVGPDKREFVGYISHTTGAYRREISNTSIVCIGATYVMKKPSQKIWIGLTATTIATQVCEGYRMSYNIIPHKRVFPQMSQAGMSDWKFLAYLARYIGYSLYPEGSSVHLTPRLQSWNDNRMSAPIINLRQSGTPTTGLLKEFYPVLGDSLPTEDGILSTPLISGMDPYSPRQLTQSKTAPKRTIRAKPAVENFSYFGARTVANSSEEAQYEADAFIERNAFPLRATAVVVGNPKLKPDYPVYLTGIGDSYDGYWLIDSVTHMADGNEYNSYLELVSDSSGRTANGAVPPTPDIVSFASPDKLSPVFNTSLSTLPITVLPGDTVTLSDQPKWVGRTSTLRTSVNQRN